MLMLLVSLLWIIADTAPQNYDLDPPPFDLEPPPLDAPPLPFCSLLTEIRGVRETMYALPEQLLDVERSISNEEEIPAALGKDVEALSKMREEYLQSDLFEYATQLAGLELMITDLSEECAEGQSDSSLEEQVAELQNENDEQNELLEELQGEISQIKAGQGADSSASTAALQRRLEEMESEFQEILESWEEEQEQKEWEVLPEDPPACPTWYLAMNLNPADGHVMDYSTGWSWNASVGHFRLALSNDYLDNIVWNMPVHYIAIVRHQQGVVDAVKVFRFTTGPFSLLQRFDCSDEMWYRSRVTNGGPIQESVASTATNLTDDPIFSVSGDLVFNWGFSNNGVRIALTGGYLSDVGSDDQNTHGLGVHGVVDPEYKWTYTREPYYASEISNIQDCDKRNGCTEQQIQGTDHGGSRYLHSNGVYGNYALYVSFNARSFPEPGYKLQLDIGQQCE